MTLQNKDYTTIVNFLKKDLSKEKWDKIICNIGFSEGGYGDQVKYYYKGSEFVFVTDTFEFLPIVKNVFRDYITGKKKRDFNEIYINITKEDFSVVYEMDTEKIKKDNQESALLFSHYVYERMRSDLFEFEIANNLLTPIYGEEGEVSDYEESWDSGLFTFIVNADDKIIHHKIEVSLNGKKRIVPLELEEYFKEAIFTHYEDTHGELKEYWKPWNKIVVTAPEKFIPLGKEREYIEYSLVDIV